LPRSGNSPPDLRGLAVGLLVEPKGVEPGQKVDDQDEDEPGGKLGADRHGQLPVPVRADEGGKERNGLLDRHGFGQVAWLIHVRALEDGDVIGQELEGNGEKDGCD
jgi:hypothetical protein